jgi:predicted TIM-barrel fold metal-dependent hydrolase
MRLIYSSHRKPRYIAGVLPQPTIDYPLQTTRCAVDLVLTGTFSKRKNLSIILSHGGGTLPFLADRVLKSLDIPQVEGLLQYSREQA